MEAAQQSKKTIIFDSELIGKFVVEKVRALVGKQAVIAKRDRLSEHKHARQHDPKPRPTKKVGHERQ